MITTHVIRQGRTMATVRVHADSTVPDADIVNAACVAAGETLPRLFGWTVERTTDHTATVTLHKD